MSLASRMNQPLFIATAPLITDEYQNQVRDWDHPTLVGAFGLIEWTGATEVTVDRDTVIANWLLFLPISANVDARSRVTDGTTTYQVVGQPDRLAVGNNPHIECRLVSIEG